MSKFENSYKKILSDVLANGTQVVNRTGVNAITSFNKSFNIDLKLGFPIVTGKKVFFEKSYHEYVWIRDGGTTLEYLHKHSIYWWDDFAVKGSLGKTYGYQLRHYNGKTDQLMDAIKEIKAGSRRAHITLWNPSELNETVLPCCYTSFTFVRIGDELNMTMEFRSSDLFLGLPYDIIVGALLLYDVADFCECTVGELGINLANAHIYVNHVQQVRKYLGARQHRLPKYNFKNAELINYKSEAYIEAPLNL